MQKQRDRYVPNEKWFEFKQGFTSEQYAVERSQSWRGLLRDVISVTYRVQGNVCALNKFHMLAAWADLVESDQGNKFCWLRLKVTSAWWNNLRETLVVAVRDVTQLKDATKYTNVDTLLESLQTLVRGFCPCGFEFQFMWAGIYPVCFTYAVGGSWGSSVSVVPDYRLDDRGSITGSNKEFFL
jgi:hypothetical protein